MSQNIPPSHPGSSSYEQPSQGGYDSGNPYLANQQDAPAPNLDENAPFLKSPQDRRVNAKMLLYVSAAVLMLLLLLFFLYKRATTDDKPQAEQKKEQETVDVPALPQTVVATPQVPVQQDVPAIDLASENGPSLPPASYGNSSQTNQGPPVPTGPTLSQRRMMTAGGGEAGQATAGSENDPLSRALDQQMAMQQQALQAAGVLPPSAANRQSLADSKGMAQPLRNPDALLVRGTYIRCILETRIITDIPGFTSCIVTEPVYSINGRRLLLPKGSKILGAYDTDATGPRVAVIWDRITTPNGYDINMKSPGVDGLGSAGHPGQFNAHWPSRIASALLISLVADAFKYAAAENGPATNQIAPGGVVVQSPYESVTARTVESMANQAVEKSMNRPATVTINQGTMLNVYVAQDVDFTGVLPLRTVGR